MQQKYGFPMYRSVRPEAVVGIGHDGCQFVASVRYTGNSVQCYYLVGGAAKPLYGLNTSRQLALIGRASVDEKIGEIMPAAGGGCLMTCFNKNDFESDFDYGKIYLKSGEAFSGDKKYAEEKASADWPLPHRRLFRFVSVTDDLIAVAFPTLSQDTVSTGEVNSERNRFRTYLRVFAGPAVADAAVPAKPDGLVSIISRRNLRLVGRVEIPGYPVVSRPCLSPDGKLLAVTAADSNQATPAVFTFPVAGDRPPTSPEYDGF